jgi:hypothetical protein
LFPYTSTGREAIVFGLVTQLWNQNPVIFVMVVGLVLFGVYAATGPLRDDTDDVYPVEGVNDSRY